MEQTVHTVPPLYPEYSEREKVTLFFGAICAAPLMSAALKQVEKGLHRIRGSVGQNHTASGPREPGRVGAQGLRSTADWSVSSLENPTAPR
jgi:hypothetical protein